MPWTNEQKREARLKKKQQTVKFNFIMSQQLIKTSPPTRILKDPYKGDKLGHNLHDYGGHDKALNYPKFEELLAPSSGNSNSSGIVFMSQMSGYIGDNKNTADLLRCGGLSIGLVHDSGYKEKGAGKGVRTFCKLSEKMMPFLQIAAEMVKPHLEPSLIPLLEHSFRLQVLRGPRTLTHTDSFRGNTPNLLYVHEPNNDTGIASGYLQYNIFPKFKASMVRLDGKLHIPHSFSEVSNEMRFIGVDPTNLRNATFYVFEAKKIVHRVQPFGNLTFGVVGIRKGKIQIIPFEEAPKLYKAPLKFKEIEWSDVVAVASLTDNRVHSVSRKRIYSLKKPNTWHKFMAWQHRHWWKGNNMVMRYHAHFRTVREVPTSSNINRAGPKTNFVDCRDFDLWKSYNNLTRTWEETEFHDDHIYIDH